MSRLLRTSCAALGAAAASIQFAYAQSNLPTVVVEGGTVQQSTGDGVPIEATTAGPVQGYRALTASSATKTETPIEQIPQNITVIPRTVINDQSAVTVSEALRNVSNVQPLDTLVIGNVDQSPYRIRGFRADTWIDGFAGNLFVAGDRDGLVNVERIEVLKGPNAILYGGGAGSPLGGVINIISKMPLDRQRYEIGATVGSYGFWNPYFDINQPLNAERTALFRLTAEYTGSKSFIDVLETKRFNINPTLTLTNKTDTTLTLQGFISNHQQQAYPGLPVDGTLFGGYRVRRDLYIGPANIEPSYANIAGVTATFDHRFNNIWSTNIKARWSQSEINQLSQSPLFVGGGGLPAIPPSFFDLNNTEVFDKQKEFSVNPTLQAKFLAGPTRNTLLLGADYSQIKDSGFMNSDSLGNCNAFFGVFCPVPNFGPLPGPTLVNLANPIFWVPFYRPTPGVGEFTPYFNFSNTYITKGLYGQLQSTLYERVHIVVGARLASLDITYNEFSPFAPGTRKTDETKLLPRAGVVVDLIKGLSAYASYSQGMKWVPFSQTFAQPAPELSESIEGGLKFNWNDVFTGTVAVFQIDRQNVPFTVAFGVGALTAQRSSGFETDMIYQPNRNWSLLANYGFADTVFSEPSTEGGIAIPVGNKVPFVSEHSGRIWALYRFDPNVAPGWSVGAGVYAASGQYVDALNLWKTDGYYTIDAKVGYENQNFRAAVTVKNLTGQEYYTPYTWFGGQVAPSAPRMVYGQISYKFN